MPELQLYPCYASLSSSSAMTFLIFFGFFTGTVLLPKRWGNSQRSSRATTQTIRQDTSTRMNRQTNTMAAVTRNFIIAIPHFKIVSTCGRYIETDRPPRPAAPPS
nr:MAG TPA: hypothetical protein [Inoviridae sp.]